MRVYTEEGTGRTGSKEETIAQISVDPLGRIEVSAANEQVHDRWRTATTPTNSFPSGQWNFIAVTLRKVVADRGILDVTVNGECYTRQLQQVNSDPGTAAQIGPGAGWVDEIAIYDRALSGEEIRTLREIGISGHSLAD
jgi:hypothetical protein